MTFAHVSVLLQEAVDLLAIKKDGIYVDCTLGGGGHSSKILEQLNDSGHLYSFDQDQVAIDNAKELFSNRSNFTLIHSNFSEIAYQLEQLGVNQVDGILYDLGVSSPQLDVGERGFSYQQDALLDMRMDNTKQITAHQLVNSLSEGELSKIFWEYGEERWSKRIAQFIVEERKEKAIDSTGDLVRVIKKAIPKGARKDGPHPAKRVFQAIRIYVNDELGALQKSLQQASKLLKTEGRLSIITFHSLEDRIVKQFIKEMSQGCVCPPQLPICACGQRPLLKNLTKKPIIPSETELAVNPRARSAKLRGCIKL